jgi:autotransporter translocation and assembly factor TamB
MSAAAVGAVLFGSASPGNLVIEKFVADDVNVSVPGLPLVPFTATASAGPTGGIARIHAHAPDRSWSLEAEPGKGRAAVELNAKALDALLPTPVRLTEFSGRGTATPQGIAFSELSAKALEGVVRGKGQLRWGDAWSFDGELSARQIDMGLIVPKLIQGGRLEMSGVVSAGAPSMDKLFAAPKLDGTFTVTKGTLTGIDLARMMGAGASATGTTVFNEIGGRAVVEQGRLGMRDLRLNAGLLGATGNADVDASGALTGTLRAEIKTPAGNVQRASIALSGNVGGGVQARR